jgi:hypothetical protein
VESVNLPLIQQVIDTYEALSPEEQAAEGRRRYLAEDARCVRELALLTDWPLGRLQELEGY